MFRFLLVAVTGYAFRVPVLLRDSDGSSSAVTLTGQFLHPLETVDPVSIGVSNKDAILVVGSDSNGAVRMNLTVELMDTESGFHNLSIPRAYAITSDRGGYSPRIVKAELGIGAFSSIMRSLGSVDFVRDSNNSRGSLIFGEDEENFVTEYCSNNSSMSVRYNLENFEIFRQNLASLWQLEMYDPMTWNRTLTDMRGYNAETEIRIESSKSGGIYVPSDIVAFVRGRIEESTQFEPALDRGINTISFDECAGLIPSLATFSLNYRWRTLHTKSCRRSLHPSEVFNSCLGLFF